MKRREFITLLGGAAAWPLAAHVQLPRLPIISQEAIVLRLALIVVCAGIAVAVVAMLMDVGGFPPSGGAIGGAVGGAIASLMIAGRGKRCSRCGSELPALRKPTSLKQALKGGWTCPKCGTEVDRNGNEITGPAA